MMYAARSGPKVPLSSACLEIISRMRLTAVAYRPAAHAHAKKNYRKHTPPRMPDNWRQKALVDTHRRVREKDDEDYETIVGCINKLSKPHFEAMLKTTTETLTKRVEDEMFRLRVSTLLFDRGIRQSFFAPLVAEMIQRIVAVNPLMREDMHVQIQMFETLYDAGNVVLVPSASDPGFDEAIIAWTKQKETKRGYAAFIGELFQRGVVPHDTMLAMLTAVLDDLQKSARLAKTEATTEHVDHLVRFLFAVSPNIKGQLVEEVAAFLKVPREELLSFTMKSRFKLEDALKILQSSPSA